MIEKPVEADSAEIVQLIADAGVFSALDVDCVRELLEEYHQAEDHGGYTFLIERSAEDRRIQGMICYGLTPLTVGTYDLYWLCVAPQARRGGIARQLFAAMEEDLRALKARMLVIETVSTEGYRPAREFYLSQGAQRQCTIPDFYVPGEDMVMYVKRYEVSS